jgi:hypothetical protein
MKERLTEFIDRLRGAGIRASVAESLDALRAATVLGVEREALRAALAATLVKDAADRPTFDALFDHFFAAPSRQRGVSEPPHAGGEGIGRGRGESLASRPAAEPEREPGRRAPGESQAERRAAVPSQRAQRLQRQRELLELPFEAMDARAVEEADDLVAELARRLRAHQRRRRTRAPRGRLDFRRTIRRSLSRGGVPIDPAFRRPRPAAVDLVALCDLSHSTATAANFFLALLAPAAGFFRRVRWFGYVDRLVEVSFEHGHVIPHEPLDLAARSDLGNVLQQLWTRHEAALSRNTLVLILGDARNNRRPPRADLLGRVHRQVRRVLWLNPESVRRWNTGDSVQVLYARHCDAVLPAANLRELLRALRAEWSALPRA